MPNNTKKKQVKPTKTRKYVIKEMCDEHNCHRRVAVRLCLRHYNLVIERNAELTQELDISHPELLDDKIGGDV